MLVGGRGLYWCRLVNVHGLCKGVKVYRWEGVVISASFLWQPLSCQCKPRNVWEIAIIEQS